jgi:hypothetical protein
LPAYDQISTTSVIHGQLNNSAGIYKHPVLIIGSSPSSGEVEVILVTTLGNTPVEVKYRQNEMNRKRHLLVDKQQSCGHDNTPVMRLEGEELEKRSYVAIDKVFRIEAMELEEIWQGGQLRDIRLTAQSLQELNSYRALINRSQAKSWRT